MHRRVVGRVIPKSNFISAGNYNLPKFTLRLTGIIFQAISNRSLKTVGMHILAKKTVVEMSQVQARTSLACTLDSRHMKYTFLHRVYEYEIS